MRYRKGNKEKLITLVERKLGAGMLFIAGNRQSDWIVEMLDRLEEQYGQHFVMLFKSITFDNGTEFSDRSAMERNNRTR